MPASFPTSPAFNEQFIPAPPRLEEDMEVNVYLEKLDNFLSGQYLGLRNLQNSVASGWLISTLRVLDLDADTITAGSIFTQDLYIGTDGNGGIRLGGSDSQIEIKDSAGTTRFLAGDIGGGVWFQVSDSAGTARLQTGSTTFIDGAIITNATITASALNITNLSDIAAALGTITSGTVTSGANVSAGAIKADTLTVDGNPAISVTGSGACVFTSGGDIIMKANGTDFNFVKWQTSGGADRTYAAYNSATNIFRIRSTGGASIWIDSDDVLLLESDAGLTVNGGIKSTLTPTTDGIYNLGSNTLRWAWLYCDNGRATSGFTTGDLIFENGYRLTEPNHVYHDADPTMGLYIMNDEWEPIAFLSKQGDLYVSGEVHKNFQFYRPDVKRRESEEQTGNIE